MPRLALRIVITGAGGQLGQVLTRELRKGGHDVAALTRVSLDVTQGAAAVERVVKLQPEVIVNAAAFGVDASEADPRHALDVNAFAVQTLADAARRTSAGLLHFSSDFVFDGETSTPYTEAARPNPRSVYGASKLLGEIFAQNVTKHWVLRVESLFGNPEGKSSIDKMVADLKAGRGVKAFSDRTVSPSYLDDVAAATRRLLERNAPPGLYHCVSSGVTTWYDLRRRLFFRHRSNLETSRRNQGEHALGFVRTLRRVRRVGRNLRVGAGTEPLLGRSRVAHQDRS